MNDVTVIGGWGQRFYDDSAKALVKKTPDDGGSGSKIAQNFVTSFMDDPLIKSSLIKILTEH